MKNILAFTLFITLALSACKKDPGPEPVDPNQLPPVTETGANILACKINGKAHVYTGIPIRLNSNGVTFDKYYSGSNEQFVRIFASDDKYDDEVSLFVYQPNWDIEVNKEYKFSKENKITAKYLYPHSINEYYTDSYSGSVTFTQYNDKIVAGKFFFKAYRLDIIDSVNITEGFFDISVSSTQ